MVSLPTARNSLLSSIRLKLAYFLDSSFSFFLKKLSIDLLLSGTVTSSGITELLDYDYLMLFLLREISFSLGYPNISFIFFSSSTWSEWALFLPFSNYLILLYLSYMLVTSYKWAKSLFSIISRVTVCKHWHTKHTNISNATKHWNIINTKYVKYNRCLVHRKHFHSDSILFTLSSDKLLHTSTHNMSSSIIY